MNYYSLTNGYGETRSIYSAINTYVAMLLLWLVNKLPYHSYLPTDLSKTLHVVSISVISCHLDLGGEEGTFPSFNPFSAEKNILKCLKKDLDIYFL